MNGARVGRRGKLSAGKPARAASGQAYPSDPYGTGVMFSGGLANGHPDGNKAKAPGRPMRKGTAKGPQGENARRAQGPRPATQARSRTRSGAEAKPAQKTKGTRATPEPRPTADRHQTKPTG